MKLIPFVVCPSPGHVGINMIWDSCTRYFHLGLQTRRLPQVFRKYESNILRTPTVKRLPIKKRTFFITFKIEWVL